MARVKPVHKPEDYPAPDDTTRKELDELFGTLFAGKDDPEIDSSHDGLAIAALSPRLALHLAKTSGVMALDLPWCARADLRELAIQTVQAHFHSDYAFRARTKIAEGAGISIAQQQALPNADGALFDKEQALVVDYSRSVAANAVEDATFAAVVARYGERGAVELTAVAAFWSFWSLFINATRPG
jgi:alkylhydroperoxidase family enzyme